MIGWWRRRRAARQAERDATFTGATDPWRPEGLGTGEWRTVYGECCDALLAYDRVVRTLPDGGVRRRLAELRDDLPPILDRALRLAGFGAALDQRGAARDPVLLDILRVDPYGDMSDRLGPPPLARLMDHCVGLRDALWEVAGDAARIAVQVRERPAVTDVAAWLDGLAAGLAAARRSGWLPAAYAPDRGTVP